MLHKAVPAYLTGNLLPDASTLLHLSCLSTEHKCEAVRRGITETWDCKKAAGMLRMDVPVYATRVYCLMIKHYCCYHRAKV